MTITAASNIAWSASDADLEIWTRPVQLSGAFTKDQDVNQILRVRLKNLEAASGVFSAMAESAEATVEGSSSSLPVIHLEEKVAVLLVLVGAAHNDRAEFVKLFQSTDWRFVMEIWEAAHKYDMAIVKASASCRLCTLSKDIRGQDALNVYTRSSMFEDEDLAKAVVKEAASAAMYSIHVSTLASLPASALYRLLSHQRWHLIADLETIQAAVNTAKSYTSSSNVKKYSMNAESFAKVTEGLQKIMNSLTRKRSLESLQSWSQARAS